MCNTTIHHRPFNGVVDPLSFSTFHLLRTCNRLMLPSTDIQAYYNIVKEHSNSSALGSTSEIYSASENTSKSPLLDVIETIPLTDEELSVTQNTSPRNLTDVPESSDTAALLSITIPETETEITHHGSNLSATVKTASTIPAPLLTTAMGPLGMALPPTLSILPRNTNNSTKSALPAFEYIAPTTQQLHHHHHHHHQHHGNHPPTAALNVASDFPLMELNRVGVGVGMGGGNSSMFSAFMHRRPRGEKRPIPDEQKDEKYYERRKRNNEAAKKSRDARKIREDRIAFRAALLEQENSILRAQVMALRDELQTMRQLISSGATTAARSSISQI